MTTKQNEVCRPKQKLKDGTLLNYVIDRIKAGWSPEAISGRLEREIDLGLRPKDDWVNHETIYRFVYESTYGQQEKLYQYLRLGKKRRTKRHGRKSQRQTIPNRVFIDDRPTIVATRTTIGHWESDTLHYPRRYGVNSLLERKTRFIILTKLPRRTADCTKQAIVSRLSQHHRETLTIDNGREHTQHEHISQQLQMPIFFCHPYHSWERGANENANGLVRRYLPRQTPLEAVTQLELDDIAEELNNRPRKVLAYQTPKEMLEYEYQKLTKVAFDY